MTDEQQALTWEQKTLKDLVFELLKEQRAKRRWKIFFRLMFFTIVLLIVYQFIKSDGASTTPVNEPHTAVISIKGPILADAQDSASNIITALKRVYSDTNVKGLILEINSPGGSAVQADQVYQKIMALRKRYPKIKVYAVCSDICASGAYYIAAASDEIYANPASMVGSIGVLMDGFGFVGTMQKLGVERRLIKAGQNKDFLDPFSPVNPVDLAHAQGMLDEVHQIFIARVKEGRGARLNTTDPMLFSGLVWTGLDALKLGLIDGYGDVDFVASQRIKHSKMQDYTVTLNPLERVAKRFGAGFGTAVISSGIQAFNHAPSQLN